MQHAVKKLPYLLRYVSDQYKTQQMCDKAILENGGTLKSVTDCYKNQEMYNKAVDNYPYVFNFVPECFLTQEVCDKAVNRCYFVFDFVPDWYKTHEMCDRVVPEDPSLIVHCPDKYITQRMYDKAVDDYYELIPDGFVTNKMIKKLYTALYAEKNILYFNENSGNIEISCNEMAKMAILNIDLNNINLDNNFDEDDPVTIILIRRLAWHIKFEKRKALKKR